MPYNPGIQYRGDQYLYQGASELAKSMNETGSNFLTGMLLGGEGGAAEGAAATWGDRLTSGLKSMVQGRESALAEYTSRNNMAKGLRTFLYEAEGMGKSDEEKKGLKALLGSLGTDQLTGRAKGFAAKQDADLRAAQLAHYAAQTKGMEDQQTANRTFGELAQKLRVPSEVMQPDDPTALQGMMNLANNGLATSPIFPPLVTATKPNVLGAYFGALAKTGATPQVAPLASLMHYLGQSQGEATLPIVEGVTKAGTPYVAQGRTFQFDPAATTAAKLDAQKEMARYHDELKQQRDAMAQTAGLRPTAQPGIFLGPKGQTVDLRSQIEKLTGNAGGHLGAQPENPPATATAPAAAVSYSRDANGKLIRK